MSGSLDGLFRPRGVAVIGATNNPFAIGHIVVKNLYEYGYKGPIYPVNPKGGISAASRPSRASRRSRASSIWSTFR